MNPFQHCQLSVDGQTRRVLASERQQCIHVELAPACFYGCNRICSIHTHYRGRGMLSDGRQACGNVIAACLVALC